MDERERAVSMISAFPFKIKYYLLASLNEQMMLNFLTVLTFCSSIALNITVTLAYDKCYRYAEEYTNSCVNITGFKAFIVSNVENSTVGLQLADFIVPEENEDGNFSLFIDVVPSKTEFSCPLVSRNVMKFGVLDDKTSQLELYFCYKSLPITVKTDLSANVQDLADCICAHFWFCRFDYQPTGRCSMNSIENCSCSDSRILLYTVDIKHPPDVFFEQEKCPNTSRCCLEWSSWSDCGKEVVKQNRYKYNKKKEKCRRATETRNCDPNKNKARKSSGRNSSMPASAAHRHKKKRRTWKFIIMIVVAIVGLLISILIIALIMLWVMKR
uniref:Uncharacterized protein n=1 Tax=Romanomermis culicivorax TaxID=13658 RepID=A0A915KWK2_ROMCU